MAIRTKADNQINIDAQIGTGLASTGADFNTALSNLNDSKNNVHRGSTDGSSNPDYPTSERGDVFNISVPGRIGGSAGKPVEKGSQYLALSDQSTGNEAAAGSNFEVIPGIEQSVQLLKLEIDMTAAATTTFTFPTGFTVIPKGIYIVTTDTDTVTNPGELDLGVTDDNSKFANNQALTGHTSDGKATAVSVSDNDVIDSFVVDVVSASTATTHTVKVVLEYIVINH